MKNVTATAVSMIVAFVMMAASPGDILAQNDSEQEDIDQIKSELTSKTVSYDFKETQFRDVINRIRQQVSFNIIISDQVDKMLGKGGGGANAGGEGDASNGFGGNSGGDSGGFGSSSSGGGSSSSGGFGSSGPSDSGGGFGSSGESSSGGFGSSNNNSSGGFGSSGDSSSGGGGFGSSGDSSSGGFGSSGGSSSGGFGSSGGGGFGSSGGSSGFGNAGGAGGGGKSMNLDDKVTIKLDNVTIMRALRLILDQKNLTAVFKLGAVHIVPMDEAQRYDIRFYDVRDLQYKLKDFKTNVTRFHNAGGYTGKNSNESGSGSSGQFLNNQMFGNNSGSSNKEIITNEKEFMKLIKGNVGSKQDWQGQASMRMTNGILVVNQTPEVHGEIDFLINRLRQFK